MESLCRQPESNELHPGPGRISLRVEHMARTVAAHQVQRRLD